jgi:hypothetical protein
VICSPPTEGVEHPAETVDSYVVTPSSLRRSTTPPASSGGDPATDYNAATPRRLRGRPVVVDWENSGPAPPSRARVRRGDT